MGSFLCFSNEFYERRDAFEDRHGKSKSKANPFGIAWNEKLIHFTGSRRLKPFLQTRTNDHFYAITLRSRGSTFHRVAIPLSNTGKCKTNCKFAKARATTRVDRALRIRAIANIFIRVSR